MKTLIYRSPILKLFYLHVFGQNLQKLANTKKLSYSLHTFLLHPPSVLCKPNCNGRSCQMEWHEHTIWRVISATAMAL